MENTNKARTKVDLITGFLGAGKTTFIDRYGSYLRSHDISYSIVENEYGMAGVDTAQLRASGSEVDELSGGCICCTLKVGFHDLLLRLAQQGAKRILVEPSGVYEAAQFFNVMQSRALQECCEIGTVLSIVDPSALCMYQEQQLQFLTHQLRLSNGILLSRTQLYPQTLLDESARLLHELAPDTPILWQRDWRLLTDADFERFSNAPAHPVSPVAADTDHSKLFQSCTLSPAGVYTPALAMQALEASMSGACGRILRLKGFLSADEGCLVVNAVPGQVTAIPGTVCCKPMLNVIGLQLDRSKLRSIFP